MTLKPYVTPILKLTVIILAFYIVYQHTNTARIGSYLSSFPILILVASYGFISLAQIISAYRSRYYFSTVSLPLNPLFSIGLYFTGSLYNSILPGGIGGDGYKLYALAKWFSFPKKTILRILLSERASGLCALLLITYACAVFIPPTMLFPHRYVTLCGITLCTLITYLLCSRYLLKETIPVTLRAFLYSFLIQALHVIVALMILYSINHMTSSYMISYLMLFLISNILSTIPISIGGVGIRELTFLYGANWLGLDVEKGIALGIVYFAVHMLMSLNGLFFMYKLEKLHHNHSHGAR